MFARFSNSSKVILAVTASAAMMVGCDSGAVSASSGSYKKVESGAPKYEPAYREGEHPTERMGREYSMPSQECPSSKEVRSFVEKYTDTTLFQTNVPSTDIDQVIGTIDHYSYETVIGTMNPKCLPSLDGNHEYKPGTSDEKLRDRWFNFQHVYVHALNKRDEKMSEASRKKFGGDGSDWWSHRFELEESWGETEEYQLMADYAVSLQLLGVVSALSGGPFFKSYGNEFPQVTNPEIYHAMNSDPWSTDLQVINSPLGYRVLEGDKIMEEREAEFRRKFEQEHGMSYEEWEEQTARELEQSIDEFKRELQSYTY